MSLIHQCVGPHIVTPHSDDTLRRHTATPHSDPTLGPDTATLRCDPTLRPHTATSSKGGLLIMNILPWPHLTLGVIIIRVVECPTSAMYKKLLATVDQEWLQTFPPSEPFADRSIWAHGNGGHLHSRMLEYAMFSSSAIHPVVELQRRIQAGVLSYSTTLPPQ